MILFQSKAPFDLEWQMPFSIGNLTQSWLWFNPNLELLVFSHVSAAGYLESSDKTSIFPYLSNLSN